MKQRILVCTISLILAVCIVTSAIADQPILVIDPHGHSSAITKIMFTPDGKTLISVSEDKTIRLWDVATGDLLNTLRHQIGEGVEGKIHASALSPDGKILAIAGWPYGGGEFGIPAYLFDLQRGEIIGLFEGHGDVVMSLDFSSDGKWLASGSDKIRIWDVANITAKPAVILESESSVYDLVVAPDDKTLVSGHIDSALRIWEIADSLKEAQQSGMQTLNTPKQVLQKHTNTVCCVAYTPDGKYFASADFDGNYFLWESRKGKVKHTFSVMEAAGDIAFARNSQLVVLSNGNKAEVYSIPDGKKSRTFSNHVSAVETTAFSNRVTAIAFYGNDLVATAGGNGYDIFIWDVNTGAVKTHITGQGKRVEAIAFGEGLQIAFGNTAGGLKAMGPLERSFDFAEMLLDQNLPSEGEFFRTRTEYQGKTLLYTFGAWYELQIKGGGTITNSPRDGWVRSYTFTPNGDVVVGSSQALRLHRSNGDVVREFSGHTGEVWGVSIARDGRILASASDDQTIKLWNLETGECLATLFIARDREWVCWTPQGYYAASAGGEKYIGWQVNQGMEQAAQYYPVSVFRERFYQPNLVKRTIAAGSFERALSEINAAREQTITPISVAEVLPPEVRWITPQEPLIKSTEQFFQIQADIQSDRELTTVKILVNGRAQAVGRGLTIDSQTTTTTSHRIDQPIPLTPGRNEVVIFAAHADAGATSVARIIEYEAGSSEQDLYMVAIGISGYQRSDLRLTYADDDALAISRIFRAQEGKMYQRVLLKELYDQDATQANIRQALEWLAAQATQKDVVIVFIAAHGQNEAGQYYLLPTDGNPTELARTGVNWQAFSDSLGNLPARVLLFLDTCHSGQLGQDLALLGKRVDNTEAIRTLSSDEYGVVILAASTGREFSLEHPDWGHGAFTKALIEALEEGNADYSQDGVINLREIDLYVAERVEALTYGKQHPTTQKPSTISRFPIAQVK